MGRRSAVRLALIFLCLLAVPAGADYVGSLVNRIFLDPASIPVILDGYDDGDVVSFVLETTPADTGSNKGHAAWMTVYVPPGAEVVNAEFVLPATNGGYDPVPATDTDSGYDGWGARGDNGYAAPLDNGFVNEVQQDTGIFYSVDGRAQLVVAGVDDDCNGTADLLDPTGAPGPQVVYNRFDWDQLRAFGIGAAVSGNGGRGNTPLITEDGGVTWTGIGSMVSGPETYYTNDYNPGHDDCSDGPGGSFVPGCDGDGVPGVFTDEVVCQGPWQRVAYANSKLGGSTTQPSITPALATGPILNTSVGTAAGWDFAVDGALPSGALPLSSNPSPDTTYALRWVHGKRRLGELENARITLRIIDSALFNASVFIDDGASEPTDDELFCLDSTGGDTSDTAAKDNPYRYYEPQHECRFLAGKGNLLKLTKFVNNEPSSGASLSVGDIISYSITFTNSSSGDLTDIDLLDIAESFDETPTADLDLLEPGNALCAWPSYDGTLPGPAYTAGSASTGTATWARIPTLAAGAQVTVYLCAEVTGGGLNDRLENTARAAYNFSPSPADRVEIKSTTGGTISTLISGRVFNDVDGSGDLTPGDAGAGGITVTLYEDVNGDGMLDGGDLLIDSVPTLTDGSYSFAGIPGGDYIVVETDPVGWTSTGDKDNPGGGCGSGNGCNTIGTITVAAGGASTLNDFFDQAPESAVNTISGTTFLDLDADAVYDPLAGDRPGGGVTVRLYRDTNGDGMVDLGDVLLQTTVSDADGAYLFTLVEQGDFVLDIDESTLPLGASLTTDNVETATFTGFGNSDTGNNFGFNGGVGSTGGVCYAVADSVDQLVGYDLGTGTFTDIGPTGTINVEAIALERGTGRLLAADADRLGVLDQSTGAFSPIGGTFGTCTRPDTTVVTVNDVDGLGFDPFTGVLWGSEREGGNDLILQIDPATGTVVPNAFGAGVSCVRVPTDTLPGAPGDIDDLTLDPAFFGLGGLPRGELYAVANSGGSVDRLIRIDKATGAILADLGVMGVDDMEGLSFVHDGTLYGTTGDGSSGPDNSLFTIPKTSPPTAALAANFPLYSDYEAVECHTAGANLLDGTVFFDIDLDGILDPEDFGHGGVTVRLYVDENNDGLVDGGDTLIQTAVSAADGSYGFVLAAEGNFVIDTDPASYPAGASFTTDNVEEADFAGFGLTDSGNDFGFTVPLGSGDLEITKTSDAGGPVVQGQLLTYTLLVSNNSGVEHTGIEIKDVLPPGVTYVPQTTVATGPVASPSMRVTEYFLAPGSFAGTSYDLTLDQDLVSDYFVILQGSDGDGTTGGGRGPDENYARLTQDPFGTGDLGASAGSDVIRLERSNAVNSWVGVVTVVEALGDQANSTFSLLDVQSVVAPNGSSSGSDISAVAWANINQVMLMGGFNGAGCTTPDPDGADTPVCHKRIFPSGVNIINWTRNINDGNDNVATSTVMVVEWGSEWTVQRRRVQGTNGGNGVNAASEYNTAAISPVPRDNTWVWGTGFTDDNGAGDAAEGAVITLGNGVNQNAIESTVAVGLEFTDPKDFEVYALTHLDLATDYRFKPDGDQAAFTVDVTVDSAGPERMALAYNGLNSTGTGDYPRSMFSARYVGDTTVRLERRRSDDEFPAWVQGIDFSGIEFGVVTVKDNVPAGANSDLVDGVPVNLVAPADGYRLLDGESMTVSFQVTVDDPMVPFSASLLNVAAVDSAESVVPEVARHVDPVVSGALGDRVWMDVDGDGVQDIGEPGLPNVEVTLFDVGGDGLPGTGDDVNLGTRLTGANGQYLFGHLAPGGYYVDVTDATVPSGLALSPGSTDPSAVFTITASEIFLNVDFGYANDDGSTAILGDYIWNDMDRDGVQDPGEIGIGGVTVELIDLSTGLAVGAPVTTTADGKYLFTGVPPGEYEVRVTDTGSVLSGSSPTTGPQSEGGFVSAPVTVLAGDVVEDLDFGFAPDSCLPRIDFEIDAAGAPLLPGQILDDEWAAWGVTFSTNVLEPIVFGSSVPTGGDLDLGTPNETCTPAGPGVGVGGEVTGSGPNCFPLENVMIVAENLVDGNGDGLVDDPDDRGAGGVITVDFASTVEIERLDIVDAEEANGVTFGAFSGSTTVLGDNAYEDFVVDATGTQLVVTFPASGAIGTLDFCLGSLRDKVWLDRDGDGLFDLLGPDGLPGTGDEETPIAGVTVDLLNAAGVVIGTTITDANGNIRFDGLADGDYTIVITDTAGVLNPYGGTTTPALAEQLAVSVTDGADVTGVNFGYNAAGAVGDTVFSDPNGNGVQDPGEAGISGVTVELWRDADGNGVFDDTIDTFVGSQATAADGSYLFAGLTPGTYFASIDNTQAALAGYTPTTTDEETGPNAAGTQIEAALVGLGDSFFDADFGYFNAVLADISGTVFEDLDRDGVEEPGEAGFSGVTVELRDCSGNTLAATVTDANGDYSFPDLPAGCYRVAVTDDFGVLVGYALTSGLDTIEVTLGPADVSDVDFGYARDPSGASIGDAVWLDENGDGIQSAVEAGISGVTLDLWLDDGDGVLDTSGATDTLIATTVTDANGEYLFSGLDAGKYFVDLDVTTLPANLTETTYPGGFDPAALIAISEGENYDQADFGYVPDAGTAVLGDRVWYDADGDGLQDPGEIGIEGVDIQLSGPSCTPVLCTVTTGPDGVWFATGLAPGEYIVTVDTTTLPPGYNTTPTNNGGDDTYTLTVVADDLFTHLDFGFDGGSTGTIGNLVWFDDNGDGDVDAGEIGVEGVTINLVRDTNGNGAIDAGEPILATVRTNAAGAYTFSGLPLSHSGDGDASDADYLIDVTDIDELLIATNKTTGLADTDNNSQADPYPVALTSGSPNRITADFGYAPSAGVGSIGSQLWHDLDLDGLFEPLGLDGLPNTADDESGFEGVTVQLWLDDGDGVFEPFTGQDNLLRSVTTDANGEYEFDGLPASTYFVTVSDVFGVLASFVPTPISGPFACPGADDTSKVDPCIVTLTAGAPSDVTADFGYAADPVGFVLSISGTVFEDDNRDALHDEPGEGVVPGATLRLYRDLDGDGALDPGEPLIGTTVSDVAGNYLFGNLPPGDYLVAADPAGTSAEDFVQTTQAATGGLQPVTLVAIPVIDQDFGFWNAGFVTTPVTLAGFEAVGGGHVTFRWTTATEVGNIGFNLWAVEADAMVRLNDQLIPAAGGDSLEPREYVYEASGVTADTFVLEDRDLYGISRYHGPFRLGEARGQARVERRPIDWRGVRHGHARAAEVRSLRRIAALGSGPAASVAGATFGAPGDGSGGGLGRPARRGRVPAVRLLVDRESIYRITYEQLLAAGADYAGVRLDHLALESRGVPVPVRVVAARGARSFGPGAYFEFVGEGLDTLYTKTNVYRLEARPGGARIAVDDSTARGGSVPHFYMETLEVENQLRYHFAAPGGDPWFEARLLAIKTPVEGVFPMQLDGWVAGAAPVTLRVEMWGLTDFPRAPDHHVQISVNGLELADELFDGLVDHPVEFEVPDSVLSPTANSLTLRLPHDTGADYDLVNYDGFRATYPRHFRARGGALTFSGSDHGAYRVEGLPSSEVLVYRVAEGSTEFASRVSVRGVPGDYSVTFPARREPARIYVAAVESLPQAGIELAPERADIGHGQTDLVVISHADFLDAVEPLVQARRHQGLSVTVVDVADLYEQFTFGVVDPEAIQTYLRHAYHKMGAEFVLLVGGDTYDYFDYLGTGSMSFIPTPYAQTDAIVRFAPVDSLYVDFDRDGIVEMALGRLPVRTVEEAERVIAKTLEYDRIGYGSTAVLAADSADLGSGYSFSDASEEMRAQLPGDWQTELAYMDDLGLGGARQLLLDRIDGGVALTSYFGHSGPTVWSFDNLFNTTDAASLENLGRPTVVAQWGCWNTYHVAPTFDTLSHVLMLSDDRGAAAVLGAATLTEATSEKKLGREVYGRIALPGVPIGRAIVEAKQALGAREPDLLDVLWGWTLLGDPTLILQP